MNIQNTQSPQNTQPTRTALSRRLRALSAGAGVTALLLTGCSAASDPAPADGGATGTSSASTTVPSGQISVTDPWAKATDEHMTGVFGVIANDSDRQLHLVGAQSEAAQRAELHETADDGTGSTLMQEKEGGFMIEPGQSLELVPGGDHIMLMQLTEPIEPGQQVLVTLEFADGTTLPLEAVAKEYAGANEVYEADDTDESEAESGDGDEDGHGDH